MKAARCRPFATGANPVNAGGQAIRRAPRLVGTAIAVRCRRPRR
jgi:hypothetical protein